MTERYNHQEAFDFLGLPSGGKISWEKLRELLLDVPTALFFASAYKLPRKDVVELLSRLFNLPVLDAEMPVIMAFPASDGRFDGPALFLTGARSDYVRPEHWPEIRRLFPDARHVEIPAAGHWLHAEAPDAFAASVAPNDSEVVAIERAQRFAPPTASAANAPATASAQPGSVTFSAILANVPALIAAASPSEAFRSHGSILSGSKPSLSGL